MRRNAGAARFLTGFGDLLDGKVGRLNEQPVQLPYRLVHFIEDALVAEDGRIIGDGRKMLIDHLAELHRGLHIAEIGQDVHFLAGGDFNAGQQHNAHDVRNGFDGGQVHGGVVVGHGDAVQFF